MAAEEDTQIVDKIMSSRIVKRKICAKVCVVYLACLSILFCFVIVHFLLTPYYCRLTCLGIVNSEWISFALL